jgi:formyltetrahydrofolate synthetase
MNDAIETMISKHGLGTLELRLYTENKKKGNLDELSLEKRVSDFEQGTVVVVETITASFK